jgi:hypothetical protein
MSDETNEGEVMDRSQLTDEQIANRLAWVNALRSGKFKQTTGYLKDRECFCAMGVAYQVMDPCGWIQTAPGYYTRKDAIKMERYYGLSYKEKQDIIDLNDTEIRNFGEIAAEIEKWTVGPIQK